MQPYRYQPSMAVTEVTLKNLLAVWLVTVRPPCRSVCFQSDKNCFQFDGLVLKTGIQAVDHVPVESHDGAMTGRPDSPTL